MSHRPRQRELRGSDGSSLRTWGGEGGGDGEDPSHQQVFWFDVPVHNVEAVQVLDGVGQVVEHAAGVPFRVSVGRGDGIEQIAPLWRNVEGVNRVPALAETVFKITFSLNSPHLLFS